MDSDSRGVRWAFAILLIVGATFSCGTGFVLMLGDCGASTVSEAGAAACSDSKRLEFMVYLLVFLACLGCVAAARLKDRFLLGALAALFVLPTLAAVVVANWQARHWQAVDAANDPTNR